MAILKSGTTWYAGSLNKKSITEIHFLNNQSEVPSGWTESWNVDVDDSGTAKGYLNGTVVYVAGDGSIKANSDCGEMFKEYSSLVTLDLEKLDTSSTTDMNSMFYKCSKLTSLDVSNFNTSNVEYMHRMFWGCSGLTELDVTNFDTSSNTNMESMFKSCSKLTSLDVSGFDTSHVEYLDEAFIGCSKLTSLNVSNFVTNNATSLYRMFEGCSSLTSLDVSGFDTSSVTDMHGMFIGCSGLTSLDVSNFDTSSVIYMGRMFRGCSGLTSLDVSNFDTSKVTDMLSMFQECTNLASIDVSNFDTSKVADISALFMKCPSLTSLDLSNFDTSSATDMNCMFDGCSSLTSLDVSNFDTSSVYDMCYMFENCSSLTSLDLSSFDTSLVYDMDYLFTGCTNLRTIYVSKRWSTASVTEGDLEEAFDGCVNLVGGNGTGYDASFDYLTYCRIDTPETPGYFTFKQYYPLEVRGDFLIQGETLYDIADAIRTKKSSTEIIIAGNFSEEIAAIDTQEDLDPELADQDAKIAELQELIQGKAFPAPEDLTEELTAQSEIIAEQDELITQLATALEGKAGASGGAEVLSGTVTPTDDYNITISDAIGKDNVVLMARPYEFNVGAIKKDYICSFTYQNGNMNYVIAGGGYLALYEVDNSFAVFIFDKATGTISLDQNTILYERFCQDTYQYFTW